MRILALDASTKATGWSVFDDGGYLISGMIEQKSKDTYERIYKMQNQIEKLIDKYNPDEVYLEDIVMERNANTFRLLGFLSGGIQYICQNKWIPVRLIGASEWRGMIGIQEQGMKRADLKSNALALCAKYTGLFVDEDEAESICINIAASVEKQYISCSYFVQLKEGSKDNEHS